MSEYLFGKPLRTDLPTDLHRIAIGNGIDEDQNVLWPVFLDWLFGQGINADTLNGYTFEELQDLWQSYADTKDAAINSNTNRISNLEENQTSGVVVFETYVLMTGQSSPDENISYKVSNDPDSSLNGYYHYNGVGYIKDSELSGDEALSQNSTSEHAAYKQIDARYNFIGYVKTDLSLVLGENDCITAIDDCVINGFNLIANTRYVFDGNSLIKVMFLSDSIDVNRSQILGFNEPVELVLNLDSQYFNVLGELTSNAAFNSTIVDVEAGEVYYVYTRSNQNTSIVDVSITDEYTINEILGGQNSNWQLLEITPLYGRLGISVTRELDGHYPFVVKKEGSLLEAYQSIDDLQILSAELSSKTELNTKNIAINTQQILGFNPSVDVDFTLDGVYFNVLGELTSNASFSSSIVDVEAGEVYYVYTFGNKNLSVVDVSLIDEYTVNTILTGDTSNWQMVEIIPIYDRIGISRSNADYSYIPLVVKKEGSLLEAYENIDKLNQLDLVSLNRYFFNNSGSAEVELNNWQPGYYNTNGVVTPNLFNYINITVESGQLYAVLTRLTSTTSVVALNSLESTSGVILFKGWNVSGWQLQFTKATTGFMGISNIGDDNDSVKLFKITDGWLYDLQNIILSGETPVSQADAEGIIPINFETKGEYAVSDGYITTQGICTNFGTRMSEDGKLLKSLQFHTNQAGVIRFGIGTIDQRQWAIVQEVFDIDCIEGSNVIDITQLGLVSIRNGYLFAYNNIDGSGTSVGYKLRDVSESNYYYYADDTTSALAPLSAAIAPNTAFLCLSYEIVEDNLIYNLKKDSEEIDNWAQDAMFKSAMSRAYQNLMIGTDGLYRINITGGALSASLLSYNKITIFGNSIFRHGPLSNGSGWLEPYTDISGDWVYTGESDPSGMAGMEGRGMASTQQEFDFKHLFRTGVLADNPSAIVQGANISTTERDLPSVFPSIYDYLLTTDVDVVIWRCGENVSSIDLYEDALRNYINHFKTRCPNALIILTGRFWKNEPSDIIVSKLADEFRLPFIRQQMSGDFQAVSDDIHSYPVILDDGITTDTAYARIGGGGGHPGNLGMYKIANQLLMSLAIPPLNLLHSVYVINGSSTVSYDGYTEQIEGALYSLRLSGTLPLNITVVDSDSNTITHTIRTKADYNLGVDYVITFIMPNLDVTITMSN